MSVSEVVTESRPEPSDAESQPPMSGARSRSGVAAAVAAVIALSLAGLIVAVVAKDDTAGASPLEITIPVGTGERLANGDQVRIIDSTIRLRAGQQLVVRNNDWRLHTVGAAVTSAGETVRVDYPTEGRHIVSTSLRPDGRVTILVEEP